MQLQTDQILPGTVSEVLEALVHPDLLTTTVPGAKVGAPELLGQERAGDLVRQRVHHRFSGDLAPAVKRVVDSRKLAWVVEHEYDLAGGVGRFRILPDHYADRFEGAGTETFVAVPGGTRRRIDVTLRVRWPVVGGAVERAIASGLREHLAHEAELLTRWITRGD